jgi:hypothetical protein
MEKEGTETKEADKEDYWIEENDVDVLGNIITNLLDTRLGINDDKVYVKVVDHHLEIGSMEIKFNR